MSRIVFLLEERSMANFLEGFLPKHYPDLEFILVPHRGKQDLQKSIPNKLRGWKEPGVKFVVVHDQDSNDCMILKKTLVEICQKNSRYDVLVRIACHELESWFLGDLAAVGLAFQSPALHHHQSKSKFTNPDRLNNAAQELKTLVPEYEKTIGATAIAAHMDRKNNRSRSFQVFLSGLDRLLTA